MFDDDNLVSCAGLVPVMALAARTGLVELLAEKVHIAEPKVKSGAANPAPKLATLVAGMCAGADSIDDVDVVRSGGTAALFGGVYAPSTIGTLLREFSFGHARQLESVLRAHLVRLCGQVDLLPGAQVRAFVDIDSLLRPTYGHDKQDASYGHTKIAGKQVLRKGLSPLATTISTDLAAPVITGMRLRAGRAGSGKGAARMVAQAIATARAAGATGTILVRGDSVYVCTFPATGPGLTHGFDCGTTQSDNGPHRCRCQPDHPAARPDRIHRKAGQTSGFLVPKHRQPRSHVTSAVQPQTIGGSRFSTDHQTTQRTK